MEENLSFAKRYGFTQKTWFSLSSTLFLILVIAVIAFANAGFDKSNLKDLTFWVDISIQIGFSLYGMIAGQQMGDDVYRNSINCAFRLTVIRFRETADKLQNLGLFVFLDDWLENYRQRKLRAKKEAYLLNYGVRQFEVLDLDITDLKKLANPYEKNWKYTRYAGKYANDTTYFIAYTKEQIKAIKHCITGKINVHALPGSFFRSATNKSEKDMWESASKLDKQKGMIIGARYSYKILTIIIFAVIMRGLTVGTKDVDAMATILNIVSRISTIGMAFYFGYTTSGMVVKEDTAFVEFKINTLNDYEKEVNLGLFKCRTLEEQAKAMIKGREVIENGKMGRLQEENERV